MKRWIKIPLIVIGSILLLLLLINALAGPIAKRYVEKHSKALCNRVATVDRIRVNIFNGTLNIDSLNIQELDQKSSFLSFNHLKVNISLARLLAKTVRLTTIELDGLEAKVVQKGSRFNFSDIIELYANDDDEKEDTTASPWLIDLRNIKIANSRIVYEDAEVGSHFGLNHIALNVPRLYFSGGNSDIGLDLNFEDGGKLAVKMLYDMERGDYNLKVKMSKFSIQAVEPYLVQSFNIAQLKGLLSGNLSVTGSLEHIMNMVASGNLSLSKFSVSNTNLTPLASFDELNLKVHKVDLQNNDYQIDAITFKDLAFHYELFQKGSTLDLLSKSSVDEGTEKAEAQDTTVTKPLKYLVKQFKIADAKVFYADHTLAPQPFSYTVSRINLDVNNLQNDKRADVVLLAMPGSTGLLKCTGSINPMNLSDCFLNVALENVTLEEFTPYSLHYLAYPITDGLLMFKSENVIKNHWLTSQNSLDIYKPTFGQKEKTIKPAAANLPMKAALYLITDRKGHVQMNLPVQGDISSPAFSFKKIIWKTIGNLMVKVVASPVDFIAKIVGDNTFKSMELPAQEHYVLSVENCHQLNDIASVMKERPQMSLLMRVDANPMPDASLDSTMTLNKIAALKQENVAKLKAYLGTQQVPATRVLLDTTKAPHATPGNVIITFDLKVDE